MAQFARPSGRGGNGVTKATLTWRPELHKYSSDKRVAGGDASATLLRWAAPSLAAAMLAHTLTSGATVLQQWQAVGCNISVRLISKAQLKPSASTNALMRGGSISNMNISKQQQQQ